MVTSEVPVPLPLDGPLFIPGRNHFTVQLDHADRGSDLTLATLALY